RLNRTHPVLLEVSQRTRRSRRVQNDMKASWGGGFEATWSARIARHSHSDPSTACDQPPHLFYRRGADAGYREAVFRRVGRLTIFASRDRPLLSKKRRS